MGSAKNAKLAKRGDAFSCFGVFSGRKVGFGFERGGKYETESRGLSRYQTESGNEGWRGRGGNGVAGARA